MQKKIKTEVSQKLACLTRGIIKDFLLQLGYILTPFKEYVELPLTLYVRKFIEECTMTDSSKILWDVKSDDLASAVKFHIFFRCHWQWTKCSISLETKFILPVTNNFAFSVIDFRLMKESVFFFGDEPVLGNYRWKSEFSKCYIKYTLFLISWFKAFLDREPFSQTYINKIHRSFKIFFYKHILILSILFRECHKNNYQIYIYEVHLHFSDSSPH